MKKPIFIATFLFTASLTAFAYFGRYATYIADDFMLAFVGKYYGIFHAQSYWYQNWSGRYSFFLLITLLEAHGYCYWWVPLTAAASISFMVVAFYIALRGHVQYALTLSLAITTLALAAAYNLGQLIYWPTGAVTYPISIPLFALSLHFLTRRNMIATSILVMLNAGFSETFAVIQIGVFIVLAACIPKFRRELFFAVALAVTGAIVVATASGNAIRVEALSPHPALLKTIDIAIHSAVFYTKFWLRRMWIEVVAAGLFGLAWPQRANKQHVKVAAMCLVPVYIGTFLPSAWAFGWPPPGRVLFALTTSAVIFIGVAASSIRVDNRRVSVALFGVALLLSSVAPARVVYEYAMKLDSYRQYANSWHARDILLRSSDKRVIILPLQGSSLVAGIEEPKCNPQYWINHCMSEFYSLDSISMTTNCHEH